MAGKPSWAFMWERRVWPDNEGRDNEVLLYKGLQCGTVCHLTLVPHQNSLLSEIGLRLICFCSCIFQLDSHQCMLYSAIVVTLWTCYSTLYIVVLLLPNVITQQRALDVFWSVCVVCLFVCCHHDNFRTSKHMMMKLGGRCIVQRSWLSSNSGVIAPLVVHPRKCGIWLQHWENRRKLSSYYYYHYFYALTHRCLTS